VEQEMPFLLQVKIFSKKTLRGRKKGFIKLEGSRKVYLTSFQEEKGKAHWGTLDTGIWSKGEVSQKNSIRAL